MQFAELEKRILAILNEAGEEEFMSLLHSTMRCKGVHLEGNRFVGAICHLFNSDMVEFATTRNEATSEWNVLQHDEELVEKLNLLSTRLTWNSESSVWDWHDDEPRLTVLLTQHGVEVSNDILKNFGWKMTEPN